MYDTGNPPGSFDPRDLFDNSVAFDQFLNSQVDNYPDRLGVQRKTLKWLRENSGLELIGSYAVLRAYTGGRQALLLNAPGIYGIFVRTDVTTPVDDGATLIIDGLNRQWARVYGGGADVRWWGATKGSGDSTAAIKAAFATGLPLYIPGRYFVKERIVSSLTTSILGAGRGSSSLYWTSDATSVGLNIVPTRFNDLYRLSGVDLLTEATVADASLLYASWAALATNTLAADNLFSPKLMVDQCEFKTVGQAATLAYPVVLDYVWTYEFSRVFVYGSYIPTASRNAEANFISKIGIDVRNSKALSVSAQGTTGGRYNDVTVQMCGLAAQTYQVEGLWVNNCDFQANFRGMYITRNNLDRTNQVRVTNTHFGNAGRNLHIYQHNYAHISGCEFSWGGANADTTTELPLLFMENSSFYTAVNNTFRGNSAGIAKSIPITGIKANGSANNAASGFAINGTIVGNVFENMTTGVNTTGYSSGTFVDPSNRFSGVTTKVARDTTAGWPALIYGNAALDGTAPSTGYPQGYFSNNGGIALGANRVGGGNVMGFYADGTLGGYINVTATSATLTNTSDQTLKDDKGAYAEEKALDLVNGIAVHEFSWKSTGQDDFGVFAQELHKVVPEAVVPGGWIDQNGEKHEEEVEGSYYLQWGVDYTKLIPIMLVALQALAKR